MGIKSQELHAKKVLIETEEQNILLENPKIIKITLPGLSGSTYQISGEEKLQEQEPSSEDIKLVIQAVGVSEEQARIALKESDGDIAKAIIKLRGY